MFAAAGLTAQKAWLMHMVPLHVLGNEHGPNVKTRIALVIASIFPAPLDFLCFGPTHRRKLRLRAWRASSLQSWVIVRCLANGMFSSVAVP
jgi:hypothetical protein